MSELICPNCGSKVNLPKHSSFGCGITLAKDTDNNKYYLNMENTTEYGTTNNVEKKENKNMSKVAERLNTLKAAGVDTSNFFSVLSPTGEEVAMKWVNGIPTPCDESELEIDPIEQHIFANGYVKNTKLHRRWIMSQMFQALNSKGGFVDWLRRHGYEYQWKMTLEEFRVMSQIEGKDAEAYRERSMFFTPNYVAAEMLKHYKRQLSYYINNLKEYKCKGVPYYRLPRYGNIFKVDVNRKIFNPIDALIIRMEYADSYAKAYQWLNHFYKYCYIKLPYNTEMCKVFVETYKGAGAYYTLKNMILFHGVVVPEYHGCGENTYSGKKAMDYVEHETAEAMASDEGYKILGLLKEVIKYNNFDFYKRLEELGVR